MFRNLFLGIALLTASLASAQKTERVQLPVTSVTVFAGGAQVNRSGKVSLPAGKSEIFIGGITTVLVEGTLQAAVNGKVTILSVVRTEDKTGGEYAGEMRKLQELSESLGDSLELNKMQLEILQQEKELLLQNRQIGGTEGVRTAELKQLADFMTARLSGISRQVYDRRKTAARLERQKRETARKLQKLRLRQSRVSTGVKIALEAPAAVTAGFRLSYIVENAGWYPLYDLRLPEEGNEAKLVSRAKVWQTTGTDWNNVSLVLSSGDPRSVRQIPVVEPYFLRNEPRPVYRQEAVMNKASVEEEYEDALVLEDAAAGTEEMEAGAGMRPMAVRSDNKNNVEYTVGIPYSVPSEAEGSEVRIAELSVPVVYDYIVVPRVAQEALLVASIDSFSSYNLPEGEISLYLDNSYRGRQTTGGNALSVDDDRLSLSMGSEKGISVKRMPKQNFRKTSGSTVRIRKVWETTLRNNKGRPVKIKVEDRYPLSQDDKIKVEELTYTRENAEADPGTGKITWTLTLQPGESVSLNIGYTVKYPREWEVEVD